MIALRPMHSAPKDGRFILAVYSPPEDHNRWKGRAFVVSHEGQTQCGYDMGWALFPGYGGVPDVSFAGWVPLPDALADNSSRDGGQ